MAGWTILRLILMHHGGMKPVNRTDRCVSRMGLLKCKCFVGLTEPRLTNLMLLFSADLLARRCRRYRNEKTDITQKTIPTELENSIKNCLQQIDMTSVLPQLWPSLQRCSSSRF